MLGSPLIRIRARGTGLNGVQSNNPMQGFIPMHARRILARSCPRRDLFGLLPEQAGVGHLARRAAHVFAIGFLTAAAVETALGRLISGVAGAQDVARRIMPAALPIALPRQRADRVFALASRVRQIHRPLRHLTDGHTIHGAALRLGRRRGHGYRQQQTEGRECGDPSGVNSRHGAPIPIPA